MLSRFRISSAVSLAIILGAALPSEAAMPTRLTAADFSQAIWSAGLVDNSAFLPPAKSRAAHSAFNGSLVLSEIEMDTTPSTFKSRKVLGKDPKIFPAVKLSFFTDKGDLVPASQDVIRYGSTDQGKSYWDVIVQPGRVWSVPEDKGWSRASFPFALVHSIEGETHNGVATFLYKGGKVSNLHFQIVQQTSPYYVEDYFSASGNVPAVFDPAPLPDVKNLTETYRKSLAAAVPFKTWEDLKAKVGEEPLKGFDGAIKPDEIVLDGLAMGGKLFIRSCPSAAGELAYCDRQRFGVWSVTKSAANALALLHLAQKYGPDVLNAKLSDYVKEAAQYPDWGKVTFVDALNMATGMGNGTTKTDPNDINDGELVPSYAQWYEARSEQDKIDAILKVTKTYPWGPGKVARYRDEDMFMLGVAMNRYLQSKEGTKTDLWTMLRKEVYEPIGIYYAPVNRTIESDGSAGQPLMAFGLYATVGDLLKIGQLYQDRGRHNGVQILNEAALDDILPSATPRGLPTGDANQPYYHKAFWYSDFKSSAGCSFVYPKMDGWGGSYVMLLPHHMIGLRLAKNWSGEAASSDVASIVTTADRISALCKP